MLAVLGVGPGLRWYFTLEAAIGAGAAAARRTTSATWPRLAGGRARLRLRRDLQLAVIGQRAASRLLYTVADYPKAGVPSPVPKVSVRAAFVSMRSAVTLRLARSCREPNKEPRRGPAPKLGRPRGSTGRA